MCIKEKVVSLHRQTDMNMKKIIHTLVLFALVAVAFPCRISAQLSVTTGTNFPSGWTADSLVRNILLGEGVDVYNVKFNGSAGVINCTSIGYFSTGVNSTNLGMDEGIIMGTGNVTMAIGPNNSAGQSNSTGICTSYPDSSLSAVSTQTLNDCAVLEFDFLPKSDSIKFEYVFASEEYPEYVCSINDVFGFFISGINPNGPQYNNQNIALIPGTTDPISINTVNNGNPNNPSCTPQNSAYFVSNDNGTSIQYDGFTTVLTACAKVYPCTPYHLKMCIADASDNILDSGVFLKKGSLSSNGITATFANPANPRAADTLFEGCCATIQLHRAHPQPAPERIGFEFFGTAGNGADFAEFNNSYYFPADSTTFNLDICPLMDGLTEGVETVVVMLSPASGCERQDTISFAIQDTYPIELEVTRDTLTSASTHCWLHAHVTGGMPNRSIIWKNLSSGAILTGDSVYVPAIPTASYQCVLEDACYNIDMDTILVGIKHNFTNPNIHDTVICAGSPLLIYLPNTDSCVWYFGERTPFELEDSALVVYPSETGVYHITSYLWWNGQYWEDNDSVMVHVVPLPEMHVTSNYPEICEGESVVLTATGCGTYSWNDGNSYVEANTHTYVLDSTTTIHVYGLTNAASCAGTDSVTIIVDTVPDIEITAGSGICNGEAVSLTVTTTATEFVWSSQPTDPTLAPQATLTTVTVNPAQTTVYTVSAQVGVCSNTGSQTIAVEPMPIAIGEVDPRVVELGNMEATFTDHSQNATTRTWIFPDGSTTDESSVSVVVPNEEDSLMLTLIAFNPYLCSDTTTVTVMVDHATLWAPNAFTPDESANNTFEVKMNDLRDYHIRIYDRNGQLVFESTNPDQPWDGNALSGKPCPQGAYVYSIIAHKLVYPYEQINRAGTVTIIR